MGLYKRGPTWWISFSYNGRQIRQSTETDDRKLAEKIHHKVMTEVAEGKWFERQEGTQTFAEMMERYMKEHSAVKKRSTVRDRASLKHLLPFFGAVALREIRPGHISRYKANRLAARGRAGHPQQGARPHEACVHPLYQGMGVGKGEPRQNGLDGERGAPQR